MAGKHQYILRAVKPGGVPYSSRSARGNTAKTKRYNEIPLLCGHSVLFQYTPHHDETEFYCRACAKWMSRKHIPRMCKRGHDLTVVGEYVDKRGRKCRRCHADNQARSKELRRRREAEQRAERRSQQ